MEDGRDGVNDISKESPTKRDAQRQALIDCIEEYISGRCSRTDAYYCVNEKIAIDDIAEDDLVNAAYWAVCHLTEKDYWTSEEEIKYLYECLSGENVYSQDGLDSAVRSIDNLRYFPWNGKVGDQDWVVSFIEAVYEKYQRELRVEKLIGLIAHYVLDSESMTAVEKGVLMDLISELEDVLFSTVPSEQPDKISALYKLYHQRAYLC